MVQTVGDLKTAVVWRPFGYPDSPTASPVSRSSSWNHKEEIIRRFSDPATETDKLKVDRYIKQATEAYHDAVAKLHQNLKKEDVDSILSTPASTKPELYKLALTIQKDQRDVLDKRKMGRFIDTIDHYSGVFDVLAQCDFSYMTLIWGLLKFGLIASKNHHDMMYKFTDVMADVGLNLPRIEVYRHMFPTNRMLELVSALYAAVINFIGEVITYTQKKTIRKYFSAFGKPFDMQYGRLVAEIKRLQECIEADARLGAHIMMVFQGKSLSRHRVELSVRRDHYETTLRDIHEGQATFLFTEIKKNLFHGFEIEANYHEELATTFKLTSSPAWAHWLSIEQKYVPSRFSHKTQLIQAECDAPDAATCLQWVAQARAEYPEVTSAYLLWARGMTAQSAIASIVFQMIQQRPQVVSLAGLDNIRAFQAANASVRELWSLFQKLVKTLGGLMVYISIGSVGEEEFGLVERFVDLCSKWDGPPINVNLIHPFNENFAKTEDCIDLDDKYDVHPSLTTTDALYHVVLLRLNVHDDLSETVQIVLWEALWREVRYAVIGIAVNQAADEINECAETLAEERELDDSTASLWTATVEKWTKPQRTPTSSMREQIQRHLDVVDIHLAPDVQKRLDWKLKTAIRKQLGDGAAKRIGEKLRAGTSRPLEEKERQAIWRKIQNAIRPGTMIMFSHSIREIMERVLDAYMENPPETERQARSIIQKLHKQEFGWNGTWKNLFLNEDTPVVDAIVASIEGGYGGVLHALKPLSIVSADPHDLS